MHPRSLKSKLLVVVSALVICSGVLISFLVSHHYSKSLSAALSAQAEYLTAAIALQSADMVLINDLVALQKMLDQQLNSHPSLAYLFILKDGRILADTFADGIPIDLLKANEPQSTAQPHPRQIASTRGEYYLDMAMPIFEGKAGVLRLGFSEQPYRQEVKQLWLRMILFTFGILMFALAGSLLFIKRITDPLGELAEAVDKFGHGGHEMVQVNVRGRDEVAVLAASFNQMLTNLNSYTRRLEEQTMELERAHQQTRTVCGMVQEIGALHTLREIGTFLVKKLSSVVSCNDMLLIVFNEAGSTAFLLSETEMKILNDPDFINNTLGILGKSDPRSEPKLTSEPILNGAFLPEGMRGSRQQAFLPLFHQGQPFGGLLLNCSDNPSCNLEDLAMGALMLNQSAPVIKRAFLHEEEIRDLQNRLESSPEFQGIVARDPKMQVVFKLIEDIAATDATALILGESGTGKELVARAVHQLSPRKDKPFIVINCAAYPSTLLESELFGHEKGAFSGAVRLKPGRFELADGGTVFLDEVGEIPLSAQIKLLRILQMQQFERVGGEKTLTVDVRIIAATNKDLLEEVKAGNFREDLYYRLNVIPIRLPPLKERGNDIALLVHHFLRRMATVHQKHVEAFEPEALKLLLEYPWPGNVRELENSIEHAVVLARGARIKPRDLPASLQKAAPIHEREPQAAKLAEHEKQLIEAVLRECSWNKKEAAGRLGISRSTLYAKLRKYRINIPADT
jgi:two-component system response regulator HydG